VAHVVVALDVIEAHRVGDAGHMVELPQIIRQVRIIIEPPQVALEVAVVHRIEAKQRREQTPVGFGQRVADEISRPRQSLLQRIERIEQTPRRALVRLLAPREPAAIHTVVHVRVDDRVDLVDRGAALSQIVIVVTAGIGRERRVEHADDFRRFVIDDRLPLSIP